MENFEVTSLSKVARARSVNHRYLFKAMGMR